MPRQIFIFIIPVFDTLYNIHIFPFLLTQNSRTTQKALRFLQAPFTKYHYQILLYICNPYFFPVSRYHQIAMIFLRTLFQIQYLTILNMIVLRVH